MRALVSMLALIGVLVAATPAAADWQWTRWGMSQAEVIEASGGRATVGEAPSILVIKEPMELGGVTFDQVKFTFEAGKLDSVLLRTTESGGRSLTTALATQFGEPVSRDSVNTVFVDRDHGNSLMVKAMPGFTYLIYSKIPDAF